MLMVFDSIKHAWVRIMNDFLEGYLGEVMNRLCDVTRDFDSVAIRRHMYGYRR